MNKLSSQKATIQNIPIWRTILGILILVPGVWLAQNLGSFVWGLSETMRGDPDDWILAASGALGIVITFVGVAILGRRRRPISICITSFALSILCGIGGIRYFNAAVKYGGGEIKQLVAGYLVVAIVAVIVGFWQLSIISRIRHRQELVETQEQTISNGNSIYKAAQGGDRPT